MTIKRCVCGDERDVHTPKERRGKWVRAGCTNTKCECTNYQEAADAEVVVTLDSIVFMAARERVARAVAAEFGRAVDDDAGHYYRVADAVLGLFPVERIAELFPEEADS